MIYTCNHPVIIEVLPPQIKSVVSKYGDNLVELHNLGEYQKKVDNQLYYQCMKCMQIISFPKIYDVPGKRTPLSGEEIRLRLRKYIKNVVLPSKKR